MLDNQHENIDEWFNNLEINTKQVVFKALQSSGIELLEAEFLATTIATFNEHDTRFTLLNNEHIETIKSLRSGKQFLMDTEIFTDYFAKVLESKIDPNADHSNEEAILLEWLMGQFPW